MKSIIHKYKKSTSFTKWFKETLALYCLELISSILLESRRKYIAIIANDHIGNQISAKGFYAQEEMNFLKNLILCLNIKEGSFIDIGANIGNHSVFFSDIFSEVHAFEPNPLVFPVLKANSEIHTNINAYNFGLSNEDDTKLIYIDKKNLGASHVREYFSHRAKTFIASKKIKIKITKLDNLLEYIGQVKVMKLDIEGMEYLALRGAEITINKFKPIIQFELLSQENNWPVIFSFLERHGYYFYELVNEYEIKNIFLRRLINIFEFFKNKKVISYYLKKIKITKQKNYVIIALQKKHINLLLKKGIF